MEKWFKNKYSPNTILNIKVKKLLFQEKSPYQTIEVYDSHDFGRLLVLDGIVNVSDKDEFVYHEMMTHVPLFTHPHPEKVLVIGGGDGGIVREIAKHPSVNQIDLVEIDPTVITIAKQFLPRSAIGFKESRLQVFNEDGAAFVERRRNCYDLIIIDAPDPIGAANSLYQKNFYNHCYNALKNDGLLTTHAETPTFTKELKIMKSIYSNFCAIFPLVQLFTASIPSYSIGIWCFVFCSKKFHPLDDFKESTVMESSMKNQYYNAAIHKASFALPTFLHTAINPCHRVA
jgi:spermidine synthase